MKTADPAVPPGAGLSWRNLTPYLAADQACYAFQVADYARQFTCYTVDLRGAGDRKSVV